MLCYFQKFLISCMHSLSNDKRSYGFFVDVCFYFCRYAKIYNIINLHTLSMIRLYEKKRISHGLHAGAKCS